MSNEKCKYCGRPLAGEICPAHGYVGNPIPVTPTVPGVFQAWTPTWTNLTLGNGTLVARYTQIGKLVHAYLTLVLGSSTSISGTVGLSAPVAAPSSGVPILAGTAYLLNSGSSSQTGALLINHDDGVNKEFQLIYQEPTYNYHSVVDATHPFTFGVGDGISFTATYEAGS